MPKHSIPVDPVSGLPIELHVAIQNDHLDLSVLIKLINHMVQNHLISYDGMLLVHHHCGKLTQSWGRSLRERNTPE